MASENKGAAQTTTIRAKIYRVLIALFAVMLAGSAGYMAYSQRAMVEHLVEGQTRVLADSYFDNINTLMLTGGMANRDIARNKLLSRDEVIDARIIRAPAVTKLYGEGTAYSKPLDDLDKRALAGESIKEFRSGENGRVLTIIDPLPASKDFRGTDCISCHVAPNGEILGAVRVDYSLSELDAAANIDLMTNIGINSALMIIGLFVIGALFSRVVSEPLKRLTGMMQAVAEGNADWSQRINIASRDEIGALAEYFNQAVSKFGQIIEDTKRQSDEATRIKTALDCVSTNVMVADKEYNIIYMNQAVQDMFADAQADLRERLPGFNANNLIGRNIDEFHGDPKHQRRLLKNLKSTHESQVAVGDRTFRIIANPVVDADGERLGIAVEWADLTAELKAEAEEQLRLEDERRYAAENLRIRTALDNVSSSVMVADEDYSVIYLNKSLDTMFHDAQDALRTVLPGFDANNLLGTSMDEFHRDPSHQRRILDSATSSVTNEVEVAGLTMKIVANPVIDPEGKRLGTVVEWANRTDEVATEKEIDDLVAAARNGELGERISLDGKEGFFLELANGINDLVGVVDKVFADIAHAMGRMAEGDLTQPITSNYAGTYDKVKGDVNTTINNIENIVSDLRSTAQVISEGASEISAGNNNLSARTDSQASALEETAASMEELTSTVRNNADNTQQANQIAGNASQIAQRGGDVVGRAVTAMQEISDSSNQIAEIIGVIDEIAFQTNLLALNASVEAARAGDQGRGFAVVATEVRNLAGRSATAAKEIKELIQDSVSKVKVGTQLVNESGETLDDIVIGVKKVVDIIAEIATASAEQSSGIDQVNKAVVAMDEVTQQNAALAEETSAASSLMQNKAQEMDGLVGFFNVSGVARATSRKNVAMATSPAPRVQAAPALKPAAKSATRPAPAPEPKVEAHKSQASSDDFDDDEWEEF